MTSDDHMRFAKCMHVAFDIFPKMMQEILSESCIPPRNIRHMIMKDTRFRTRLNSSEINTLQTLESDGYMKLDFSFIFKIFKYFRLIDLPTRNWGAYPLEHETRIGDDISRIVKARSNLMNKCDASISEQSYREFFDIIMPVSRRLDIYLNKPRENGYENMIQEYKSSAGYNIEDDKLLEDTEKDACLKRSLKEKTQSPMIPLYYGNDIKMKLDVKDYQEEEGSLKEKTQSPMIPLYYGNDIKMKLDVKDYQEEEAFTIYAENPDFDVDSVIKILDGIKKTLILDKGGNIPEQIRKMDKESVDIYLNALKSGSERRRDINLILVGKKGVGKTSLVRKLFGEELKGVKSTNGIEVHRRRCVINLSDWEWKKVPDTTKVKEESINKRILQIMINMTRELNHDEDVLSMTETDKNKDTESSIVPQTEIIDQLSLLEITESPFSELAKTELLSLIESDIDLQDEDSYATLTVWDFAGDIEYYNTHQTFLNPEAIFLVVANLHDIDDTESYSTFNFWMDTIHCYGSVNDKSGAQSQFDVADSFLDPPVIAIGTHKDKFQDEEQCRKRLASYTDKIFKDSKLHLRSIHLISNTEDEDHAFRKLRNDIFATAKSSANWNREYPVKFIQMEKAINSELTIGKQIISFARLKELGEKIPFPITDDMELHLFLGYQHEIGNVIFFEDIPSYIILDPQWLANAFTCIVTAQQFQLELPHLQWDNFKQTGKMDPKLLEEVFKKQSEDMRIHKEHILEVIEKFDIIIYPLLLTESGNVQREHSFYVPCMLQTLKIKDIDVLFNVPNASKSTCLCFVFSFLPPYLISNLIVSCLREYPLAVVKGEIGLFKDCCVFNIGRTGCAKFVLAKSSYMIQLQVWQWDEVDTEVNQAVLKIVEREINRIVNTRYKLKTVSFEKKWKCETTSFSFDTGFLEFHQVHDGENYYCEEHATVHKYKDYWSGEKSKAPRRISSEQQNYVRMSMIVLEVLSGVLYDRLYIDTNTGEILDPNKLDITEMLKKYRALKINFPSKGYREIGRVDEISTNEDNIGDDIQRIRVIRNEMHHSKAFALDDTRYQTLITIVHDMLTRFDQRNIPTGESYVKRLDEIRKMELETRSFEEIKERMKAGFREKIHEVFDRVVSDALNDIC